VFFVRNFGAKPNVTRKKLPKQRSYEKRARKTLMRLTSDKPDKGTIFSNELIITIFSHFTVHGQGKQQIPRPRV